jgi:methylated-DNA-[protein]-cysteine S-methyltransferase
MKTMTTTYTFRRVRIDTPTGPMLIVTDDQDRLRALDWESHTDRMHRLLDRHYGNGAVKLVDSPTEGTIGRKLGAYFEGDLTAIDAIPTETAGTSFQRAIWAALRDIPAGQTWTYGRLAAHVGRPDAVRAAGLANGANPVSVVVPCHRVIGADGSLTGYGGGLDRKTWLLRHEGAVLKPARAA